jgi:acetyltransferase-like isoleucine patch superfamily enzyme
MTRRDYGRLAATNGSVGVAGGGLGRKLGGNGSLLEQGSCMRERGDEFRTGVVPAKAQNRVRLNIVSSLAVTDSTPAGIILRKLLKVMKNPRLAVALLNAQLRLRGGTTVPLSVRLHGKIRMSGVGHLVLGNGITLVGNIVPIEFVSHKGACIRIGDHTFINYGSSISAHELVSIGRHCLLGHYTLILDNNEHDLQQHRILPPSNPVVIEDHVWIGSLVCILPGVRIGHHSAVGAGSVVTSDIPPYCLAAGNPARVIRGIAAGDGISPIDRFPNQNGPLSWP